MRDSIKNVTSPRNTNEAYTSLTKLKITEQKRVVQKQQSQRAMLRRLGVNRAPHYNNQRTSGSDEKEKNAESQERKLKEDTDLCFVSRKLITEKREDMPFQTPNSYQKASPERAKNARISDRSSIQLTLLKN